jgi:hypothetical protein
MIMKEKKEQPLAQEQQPARETPSVLDDDWENCKGQCGSDPWCRECMREKERLHEERLNRQGRSDDKID